VRLQDRVYSHFSRTANHNASRARERVGDGEDRAARLDRAVAPSPVRASLEALKLPGLIERYDSPELGWCRLDETLTPTTGVLTGS
jgi:hypothetical protein